MGIGSNGGDAGGNPFRRSWLLNKLDRPELDADDLEWRIARLKRAHELGVTAADFADLWLQCMRSEIRSRIGDTGFRPGLASQTAAGDAEAAARLARLTEVAAALAGAADEEPDPHRQATLFEFFRATSLDTAWFGRTEEEWLQNRRDVLREMGRLKALPATVTLVDLAEAMARPGEVETDEVAPADPISEESLARFAALHRRPTAEEVLEDFGVAVVMAEAVADEMAKPAEQRVAADLRNMRACRRQALERISLRLDEYFMADSEYPDYVPADDPGRQQLLRLVSELDAMADAAIRTWNGASVDEIHVALQMLDSLALFTGGEFDPSRFESRLMIGLAAVDGYVVDDEPDLLFQDIDGNVVFVIEGGVEIRGFPWGDGDDAEEDHDDEDEDGDDEDEEGEDKHPLVLRDEKWAGLTVGSFPAVAEFVRRYGGPGFWRGSIEEMCRRAAPELAALADESELFGEHVRCAYGLLLDTWEGRESAEAERRRAH